MSVRTILIVFLALLFGGTAAVGINRLHRLTVPQPNEETVPVVVTTTEIPRFTTLTPDHIRVRRYPKSMVSPEAIHNVEDALERGSLTVLMKNEVVLEKRLGGKGARGMAMAIPQGMRAFTIRTPNVAAGVAGFILPGSKVDILLTLREHGPAGDSTTTLLQNVEVLAVDQRVEAPAENKVDPNHLRSVTLLVNPEEAAKLDLGQNRGILHLALRNPQDTTFANVPVATLEEIRMFRGRPKVEKEAPKILPVVSEQPPEEPLRIRTMRGTVPGVVELR